MSSVRWKTRKDVDSLLLISCGPNFIPYHTIYLFISQFIITDHFLVKKHDDQVASSLHL